jgi:DNA-binding protein H-NS
MATQSYSQLQREIAKLQEEAETVRATEVAGVVAKIKEAIAIYGLEPTDLFGRGAKAAKQGKQGGGAAKSKSSSEAKYSNGQGGEWVGRGPRPLWLRDAIASGRSLEEFAIGGSGSTPSAAAPTAAPAKKATGAKAAPAKKGQRKASYKDQATGKTWSGFGRQPEWLKKALAAGQSLESLEG